MCVVDLLCVLWICCEKYLLCCVMLGSAVCVRTVSELGSVVSMCCGSIYRTALWVNICLVLVFPSLALMVCAQY